MTFISNLFMKKQEQQEPESEDDAIVKARVQLQHQIFGALKDSDIKIVEPSIDQMNDVINYLIGTIPVQVKEARARNTDYVFLQHSSIQEPIQFNEQAYVKFILPQLVIRLKEMKLKVHHDTNAKHVYLLVSELKEFCRYDKLKTMV